MSRLEADVCPGRGGRFCLGLCGFTQAHWVWLGVVGCGWRRRRSPAARGRIVRRHRREISVAGDVDRHYEHQRRQRGQIRRSGDVFARGGLQAVKRRPETGKDVNSVAPLGTNLTLCPLSGKNVERAQAYIERIDEVPARRTAPARPRPRTPPARPRRRTPPPARAPRTPRPPQNPRPRPTRGWSRRFSSRGRTRSPPGRARVPRPRPCSRRMGRRRRSAPSS
jgi:hypothetical protein